MKKTLLTGGLMLAGVSLFAQSHHFSLFKKEGTSLQSNKHRALVNNLLAHQMQIPAGAAQKPTGMQQRVIAQAVSFEGEGMDSTKYSYSGTRTSRYNHNTEELTYNTEFESDYLPNGISSFAPRSIDLQADNIFAYGENGDLNYSYKAFYGADTKIDSFYSINIMGPNTDTNKYHHLFNSNGYLTQVTELDENISGTSFDTVYVHRYYYNSSGSMLLSDTLFDYNMGALFPFSYTKYHYTGSNQLDTISEYRYYGTSDTLTSRISLSYEAGASGRINGINSMYYDSDPMWNYGYADSFGYSGTSPIYTFYQGYYLNASGNIEDGNRTIKMLGTNNQPDSLYGYYAETAGAWELVGKGKYYYNSFNNPDSLVVSMDQDGEITNGKYHFYYETYDDGNSIGIKDPQSNKNFNIYPNPFDNKINIDWKNAATQAKVSLINMMGQTIYTSNKSLSTGNNTIDMPATASGTYILMIQDEKGNTYNQKLTKR